MRWQRGRPAGHPAGPGWPHRCSPRSSPSVPAGRPRPLPRGACSVERGAWSLERAGAATATATAAAAGGAGAGAAAARRRRQRQRQTLPWRIAYAERLLAAGVRPRPISAAVSSGPRGPAAAGGGRPCHGVPRPPPRPGPPWPALARCSLDGRAARRGGLKSSLPERPVIAAPRPRPRPRPRPVDDETTATAAAPVCLPCPRPWPSVATCGPRRRRPWQRRRSAARRASHGRAGRSAGRQVVGWGGGGLSPRHASRSARRSDRQTTGRAPRGPISAGHVASQTLGPRRSDSGCDGDGDGASDTTSSTTSTTTAVLSTVHRPPSTTTTVRRGAVVPRLRPPSSPAPEPSPSPPPRPSCPSLALPAGPASSPRRGRVAPREFSRGARRDAALHGGRPLRTQSQWACAGLVTGATARRPPRGPEPQSRGRAARAPAHPPAPCERRRGGGGRRAQRPPCVGQATGGAPRAAHGAAHAEKRSVWHGMPRGGARSRERARRRAAGAAGGG